MLTDDQSECLALVTELLVTHANVTRTEVEAAFVERFGLVSRHRAKRCTELLRLALLVEGPIRQCRITGRVVSTVCLPSAVPMPNIIDVCGRVEGRGDLYDLEGYDERGGSDEPYCEEEYEASLVRDAP